MRKLTTEEFIVKSKLIWGDRFDYSLVEYKTSNDKVKIICREHGEFLQRASAHLDGQGCMECRLEKRRTGLDFFLEKCYKIHGDRYNYSLVTNYVNSQTKVDIICKLHGVFKTTPDKHTNSRNGCPKCKSLGIKNFIEKSNNKHKNKYDYSLVTEYINNKQKIDIICKEHGIFNQRISDHMIKGTGCPNCALDRVRLSTEEFIIKASKKHNNKYIYSSDIDFKFNKEKIEIYCKEHGIFQQRVDSHLNGQGCPECRESFGELEVKKYLINNCIIFESEKRFKDCTHKSVLPFDFYLPDYNICIEYNGVQHYKPIEYFGGIENYNNQLIRDKIKNEYCIRNNIHLIIIKYDELVEDKLSIFLNSRRYPKQY